MSIPLRYDAGETRPRPMLHDVDVNSKGIALVSQSAPTRLETDSSQKRNFPIQRIRRFCIATQSRFCNSGAERSFLSFPAENIGGPSTVFLRQITFARIIVKLAIRRSRLGDGERGKSISRARKVRRYIYPTIKFARIVHLARRFRSSDVLRASRPRIKK